MTGAQQQIALKNQNLVYYWLNRMGITKTNPLYEDFVQEGMLGLCMAAKVFDPQQGAFSTFASSYIKGYVQSYRATRCQPGGINLTRRSYEKGATVEAVLSLDVKYGEQDIPLAEIIPDDFDAIGDIVEKSFLENVLSQVKQRIPPSWSLPRQRMALRYVQQLGTENKVNLAELARTFNVSRQLALVTSREVNQWLKTILANMSVTN